MRITRNFIHCALTGLMVFATGSMCFADTVVYDNLGSSANLYSAGGATVSGPTSNAGSAVASAFAFTPSSTVDFTQLMIGTSWVSGTNAVTVELLTDSSGPGTLLESWNLTNLPSINSCCTILQDLTGNGTIALDAGTTYWVAEFPGASDTWADWGQNTTGAVGPEAQRTNSGFVLEGNGTAPTGALEIEGTTNLVTTATPEPSSFVLLGSGLLAAAWARQRRLQMSVAHPNNG